MPWFKVDDGLHASVKARRAGEAMALWVMAGSWCADQLTDGWVPQDITELLAPRTWKKWAARLVDVRLWVAEDRDGHAGWRFHDWANYQPSKDQVLADREAAAERQRRARDRARDSRVSHGVTDGVTTPVSHGPPDPTRPDPTNNKPSSPPPAAVDDNQPRATLPASNVDGAPGQPGQRANEPATAGGRRPPAEKSAAKKTPAIVPDDDPDFVTFWAAYPKRVGKIDARKAWTKAVVKGGADPKAVVAGAERYAGQRNGQDEQFTAYPATWLNGERWADQPSGRLPVSTGWWDN